MGHRGRGRPARAYVVSEAGHQALESDYDHLATEALRFLADEAGDEAVTRFVQRRVKALEERYAAELADAGQDRQARTAALVRALTRDGFAASARPVGGPGSASPLTGIQLCQGHCPVQHAAGSSPSSVTPRPMRSPACWASTSSGWPRSPTATTCAPPSSPRR